MSELFPIVALERCDDAHANQLLERWQHPLGACNRPFRQVAHSLTLHGIIIGVTVTASTVSATCGGDPRPTLVELARIARHPDERWVLRPLLRLWRECIGATAMPWRASTAVSYSLPGYSGDIYRFDGWELVGEVERSGGGGTWSAPPEVNRIVGKKKLWRWRYDS